MADGIISCDPTRNPTIARGENSTGERDARNLATLLRVGRVHPVFVAPEPYRTLRSLLKHDVRLSRWTASTTSAIKALCRRDGIGYRRSSLYGAGGRVGVLEAVERPAIEWQMRSLYRQLGLFLDERRQVPSAQVVKRFLEVMDDPANHPVLVHCTHGCGRTGVMSALYRIEYQGWTDEAARREAQRLGGWHSSAPDRSKGKFLLEYAPRARLLRLRPPIRQPATPSGRDPPHAVIAPGRRRPGPLPAA